MPKLILKFIITLILIPAFSWGCKPATADRVPELNITFPEEEADSLAGKDSSFTELSFVVVGDLMCHSPQFKYARKSDGTYDFEPVFRHVKPILEGADFTFGNLETVLAGSSRDYSGYPAFNTPNSYADALKKTGFDLIVTTNNHSYDRRKKGVLRTLEELHKRDFLTVGTNAQPSAQDSVIIYERKGIKFSVLAYTQFSNIPLPKSERYLVNMIDTAKVGRDIRNVRAAGAELVIVHYHWGKEYLREPGAYQKRITEQTIKLGADIIIGGHPHVIQPLKQYKTQAGSQIDSGFVAYSMGNFFSNQRKRYRDSGLMLRFKIRKNKSDGKVSLEKTEFVPTWVFKGSVGGKASYRIMPAAMEDSEVINPFVFPSLPGPPAFFGKSELFKMKQAYTDTRYILGLYDGFAQPALWADVEFMNALEESVAKKIMRQAEKPESVVPHASPEKMPPLFNEPSSKKKAASSRKTK